LWPKHVLPIVLAVVAAGLFAGSAAHATSGVPTSTLYITDFWNTPSELWTIQGGTGAITGTTMQGGSVTNDTALAVTSTIKTLGINEWAGVGASGYQYTLSGVFTGTTYANPVPSASFYDGASDGTNNYSVDYNTGKVYEFNGNWGNPTVLFTDPTYGAFGDNGITYETTNNTIWLTNVYTSTLLHYTLNGTLLADYQLNSNNNYQGLALDPADGTLWTWNGNGALEQYSQAGVLLSTLAEPDILDPAGMEFAEATPTPIPGALLLFAPGLAGLALVRRRFGK
jgi:hypothetical protein